MKRNIRKVALIPLLGVIATFFTMNAEKLVILHTNDTHSSIDVLPDGSSGILQRKAIIDSVRNAEKNVIVVDAGDMVQGSLYFKYFGGEVEYPLMEMTGYDIRILGNHEFDNGMEALAGFYKKIKADKLSANYDFTGTQLEGVFLPYVVKEIGDKKIGFFGLNIDPESIISKKNIDVNFKEVIPTADSIASLLKYKEGCDLVVAVTHIGYKKSNDKTTDIELAAASKDIDIIIGGHSHTLIDPSQPEINPSLIENSNGRPVRVAQTGRYGKYIGKITVDLDNLRSADGAIATDYELITVSDRFPEEALDSEMIEFLAPYKQKVDSVNNLVIARSAYDMVIPDWPMANMTSDFAYWYGNEKVSRLQNSDSLSFPRIDMAIMNVGGIRQPMPKGNITEGQILSTYPFSNSLVVIKIKGQDIIDAMKVSAKKGGEAISGNARVVTDKNKNLKRVIIDGEEVDPEKEYVVITIDYLAEGNDDLKSLANHKKLWTSEEEVSIPILEWFKMQNALGLEINPDSRPRFVVDVNEIDEE